MPRHISDSLETDLKTEICMQEVLGGWFSAATTYEGVRGEGLAEGCGSSWPRLLGLFPSSTSWPVSTYRQPQAQGMHDLGQGRFPGKAWLGVISCTLQALEGGSV